ncbi:MAG: sodium:calcium antiporter [Marinilabiliales bacterium]|nr:MAG: sodium:calcium antiporter [Marinilabiliales bacterium]
MDYFYLILGFTVLLISGDLLVKSGVALSAHMRISTLVIGVTVVSLGTSAPELVVSIGAILKNHPDIAVGNVVGSNISNIALVLGLTAIIISIPVNKNSVRFDWPYMMFASLLFTLFVMNGRLSFIEGAVSLVLLAGFIFFSVRQSRIDLEKTGHVFSRAGFSVKLSLLLLVISSAGLYFGASWLVDGAESVAHRFGVSERVISVTIIAFGTSVPELATSVMAALKKQLDISIGNIIGSNIFNLLGILGITSMIKTIPVSAEMRFDVIWMLAISLLLLIFMLPYGRASLGRWKGTCLLVTYILYIYIVFKF